MRSYQVESLRFFARLRRCNLSGGILADEMVGTALWSSSSFFLCCWHCSGWSSLRLAHFSNPLFFAPRRSSALTHHPLVNLRVSARHCRALLYLATSAAPGRRAVSTLFCVPCRRWGEQRSCEGPNRNTGDPPATHCDENPLNRTHLSTPATGKKSFVTGVQH
jgi:hypothetical protein